MSQGTFRSFNVDGKSKWVNDLAILWTQVHFYTNLPRERTCEMKETFKRVLTYWICLYKMCNCRLICLSKIHTRLLILENVVWNMPDFHCFYFSHRTLTLLLEWITVETVNAWLAFASCQVKWQRATHERNGRRVLCNSFFSLMNWFTCSFPPLLCMYFFECTFAQ